MNYFEAGEAVVGKRNPDNSRRWEEAEITVDDVDESDRAGA